MISAFIIYVHPQLQKDPNEETADLLRVLLYKTDNTSFGGDVPEVPKWTGPPHTVVAALVLLYLGLAAVVITVTFAIIIKQFLNVEPIRLGRRIMVQCREWPESAAQV